MRIVGLTGTMGSGKELVKEILKKKFSSYTVTLSSVIKAELEKKKKIFDRKTLQDHGNELRKKYGGHVLALLAISYLQRNKDIIVIDGIRNPGEIDYLKSQFGKGFVMIAVDAPQQLRFERITKRGDPTDPKTFEEFVAMDERDQGKNEPEWGQQVKKCMEMADFTLVNDGSVQDTEIKLNEIMNKL